MADGFFLGGMSKGMDRSKANRRAAEQLEQGRRAADLAEQRFQHQVRADAQATIQQNTRAAIGTVSDTVSKLRAAGRPEAEIRATVAPVIEDMLKTREAVGLPVEDTMHMFDLVLQSPSPDEVAAAGVGAQAAQRDALIAQGIDPEIASETAFGLTIPDQYAFLTPEELQAQNFAPNAIVQRAPDGKVVVISEGGEPDPLANFEPERKLRTEFDKASADFEESQRNLLSMETLADDGTGASDVNLVFSFFKVIDPSSTVREGEFAQAASTMGVPARIVTALARVDSGELLSADLRDELVDSARRQFAEKLVDQREREGFYTGLAERGGLAPGNVVRSRIRVTGFGDLTNAELANIDPAELSEGEKADLSAELERRGF